MEQNFYFYSKKVKIFQRERMATEKSFWDRKFKPAYLVKLISIRIKVRSLALKNAAFDLKVHFSQCLNKIGLLVVRLLSLLQLFVNQRMAAHSASLPFTSPGVCSNSSPLSWWRHPTISSSVLPFSPRPQSFPAWRSFPTSQLLLSGGQSTGASASVSSFQWIFRVDRA